MSNASLKGEPQKLSLKIATRGSQLAIWQAKWVRKFILDNNPEISVELIIIKTKGDKVLDKPLSKIGGKGLFVKELEKALLERKADIAVHSLKDMTASLQKPFCLAAVLKRHSVSDLLIAKKTK